MAESTHFSKLPMGPHNRNSLKKNPWGWSAGWWKKLGVAPKIRKPPIFLWLYMTCCTTSWVILWSFFFPPPFFLLDMSNMLYTHVSKSAWLSLMLPPINSDALKLHFCIRNQWLLATRCWPGCSLYCGSPDVASLAGIDPFLVIYASIMVNLKPTFVGIIIPSKVDVWTTK